jgi:hypothetical protein
MTDVTAEDSVQGDAQQPALSPVDQQLVDRPASRAHGGGVALAGEGGLLESALEVSSPATSATTATTRPGGTAATRATDTGPRPC